MNAQTKLLFKDRTIRFSSVASTILLLFMIGVVVFFYVSLPPVIPLYNQLPWGVDRLARTPFIFLPILLGLACFTANIIFSARIYQQMPLIARIVNITTFLCLLLSLIFLARTLQLVL